MIKERFFDSKDLEEYILSVCMHKPGAALKCTAVLSSGRDFSTSETTKAFSVIETLVDAGDDLDSMVIINRWVDLSIYSEYEARDIFLKAQDDMDFEPKLKELKESATMRNARNDIVTLNEMTYQDIKSEKLISKAMELVASWSRGKQKSYQSAREVEQDIKFGRVGQKLRQGIPLLDDQMFAYAGQHRGTVRGTIMREKHGKTRYATWDASLDLMMGNKVLYLTLEGQSRDIYSNFEEVLQADFDQYKDNLFIVDARQDIEDLCNTIVEAVYNEGIEKMVCDYIQLAKHPRHLYLSENENTNKCCNMLTQLCVKHDLLGHFLAQPVQEDKKETKWGNVPGKYSVYGSKQLIKDCSMLLVGFRPEEYEDLIISSHLGTGVEGPDGTKQPLTSLFIKSIVSRKKNDAAHKWLHLVDSDRGLQLHQNELL